MAVYWPWIHAWTLWMLTLRCAELWWAKIHSARRLVANQNVFFKGNDFKYKRQRNNSCLTLLWPTDFCWDGFMSSDACSVCCPRSWVIEHFLLVKVMYEKHVLQDFFDVYESCYVPQLYHGGRSTRQRYGPVSKSDRGTTPARQRARPRSGRSGDAFHRPGKPLRPSRRS